MDFKRLVQNKARLAFRLAGSLCSDITLREYESNEFDFSTGSPSVTLKSSKVVKGVFTDASDKEENKIPNSVQSSVIILREDIDNPNLYTELEIGGIVWKITPPFKDNGYTISLKVWRPI